MIGTSQIYVACLAAYNNGFLHGKWIDTTQSVDKIYADIQNMLAESPIEKAEEFAIHGYQGFGELALSENECIAHIVSISKFITEHGELGAALLSEYTLEEAQTLLDDHYYGVYDSEIDFACSIFEDCYGNAIPENLQYYFDHKAFARDLFMCDYFSVEVDEQIHIFSNF